MHDVTSVMALGKWQQLVLRKDKEQMIRPLHMGVCAAIV